jgi:hypothetical protein
MSLVATGVLVGFITVSGTIFIRSRRPAPDGPSAIMMRLSDRADELERLESQSGQLKRPQQAVGTESTRMKTPFTPYGVTLKTKSQAGS